MVGVEHDLSIAAAGHDPLLMAHCTDLGRDAYIQGKGMPNLIKMLLNT